MITEEITVKNNSILHITILKLLKEVGYSNFSKCNIIKLQKAKHYMYVCYLEFEISDQNTIDSVYLLHFQEVELSR